MDKEWVWAKIGAKNAVTAKHLLGWLTVAQ